MFTQNFMGCYSKLDAAILACIARQTKLTTIHMRKPNVHQLAANTAFTVYVSYSRIIYTSYSLLYFNVAFQCWCIKTICSFFGKKKHLNCIKIQMQILWKCCIEIIMCLASLILQWALNVNNKLFKLTFWWKKKRFN